jgi:hypothetical protein
MGGEFVSTPYALWPSSTATTKLRIATLGISGGRSLTRPFRDARRFPSIVARTHMYTHDAKVWGLSLVQGPNSCRPVPNVSIRNFFASLYISTGVSDAPDHLSHTRQRL